MYMYAKVQAYRAAEQCSPTISLSKQSWLVIIMQGHYTKCNADLKILLMIDKQYARGGGLGGSRCHKIHTRHRRVVAVSVCAN